MRVSTTNNNLVVRKIIILVPDINVFPCGRLHHASTIMSYMSIVMEFEAFYMITK